MSVKVKKCVSPCKGIIENKCKTRFCNYVNKTRKYCTLNRKLYQLKHDDRGCNIYPKKKDENTKNTKKTSKNINKSINNKLINKATQAKKTVLTRKVEALRKKHAEKKIKKFMTNPVMREKITAMFLNSICSDSGVCIAFGQEAMKIKKFFNNFTDFTYLNGPIKKIGVVSANGFIYELAYKRQNYNAYAILKSTVGRTADNLMYEYFVGMAVNVFGKQLPCFVETYGLFEYNTDADWTVLRLGNANKDDVLKHNLTLKPTQTFDNLDRGCISPHLQCILIQHLKQSKDLRNYVKDPDFINTELIKILYIIYFSLSSLATQFTHYDLHSNNVLLYEPGGSHINYVFHEHLKGNAPRLIKFKSKFIPKIIDYGRCFYSLDAGNNSNKIYETLCTITKCNPLCGENYGFNFMNSDEYHIKSRQHNVSHDLRLLQTIKGDILSPYSNSNNSIKYLFNSVVYDEQFGTPENTASGLPTEINNVTDALYSLSDMVAANEPTLSNKLYHAHVSYGELHIYSDGRHMEFIKK